MSKPHFNKTHVNNINKITFSTYIYIFIIYLIIVFNKLFAVAELYLLTQSNFKYVTCSQHEIYVYKFTLYK